MFLGRAAESGAAFVSHVAIIFRPSAAVSRDGLMESCTCRRCGRARQTSCVAACLLHF